MWRYFKAAFLVGVDVPGLGRLPLNALGAAGLAILGFVEPSIWLAGIGIEVAVVSALAFNPRFQKLVEARTVGHVLQDSNAKRAALIATLPEELRARLGALEHTSARILSIYQTLGIEAELLRGTESSLDKLQWIYLKLLIARTHLTQELNAESEASLELRIQQMQQESSAQPGPSTALQRSQEATLAILRRRLENLQNRDRILRENDSDLSRIEAQVQLMRENAAIEGKPASVETEIELASDLASPDLFGSHSSLVRDLDEVRR
ncbi:MAG TPA: hypothetical protein VGM27_28030 [Acidobacteriaceae bacterium]